MSRKQRHGFSAKQTVLRMITSRNGKVYSVRLDGSIHRNNPFKVWRGKSERRRWIANRRIEREEAA